MPAPILATKLYIPPPRPRVVHRARLIDRLQAGLQRAPGVILISAPAGFGKTTLVSEWLAGRGGVTPPLPIAWLSLDKEDDDLPRFLAYFIAALQTIAPAVGEATLGALHASQPPPADVLLTALLNDLAALGETVLVLDDYHVIESPAIEEALTFFVDHLPPQFRLVIATREDPPLPLARLRARGQLTELRATDLRFTSAEAADFLNQVMGLNLAAADVAALENRTEGWIAGLQLAAISMQGRSDTGSFIQAFTGSHRFVLDYLMEEVLQRQPERVRGFLLQTAILDRLSGDCVMPSPGSQTAKRCWKRWSAATSSSSRSTINAGGIAITTSSPKFSGRTCRRRNPIGCPSSIGGRVSGTSRTICRPTPSAMPWPARISTRAANLIERVWLAMDVSYQSAAWLRWAQQLPADLIRGHPVLCLGYGWALLNGGELEACEPWLRDAERWIDPTPEAAAQMVVVDEAEYRALPAVDRRGPRLSRAGAGRHPRHDRARPPGADAGRRG